MLVGSTLAAHLMVTLYNPSKYLQQVFNTDKPKSALLPFARPVGWVAG